MHADDVNAPHELRVRVREYFTATRDLRKKRAYNELYELMSLGLCGEVKAFLSADIFRAIRFLRDCESEFLETLTTCITYSGYARREVVRGAGENVFLVVKGVAAKAGQVYMHGEVFGEDMIVSTRAATRSNATSIGQQPKTPHDMCVCVWPARRALLWRDSVHCGSQSSLAFYVYAYNSYVLWQVTSPKLRDVRTARALTYLELASLSRVDLEECMINFPESRRVVRVEANKIALQRAVQLIASMVALAKELGTPGPRRLSDQHNEVVQQILHSGGLPAQPAATGVEHTESSQERFVTATARAVLGYVNGASGFRSIARAADGSGIVVDERGEVVDEDGANAGQYAHEQYEHEEVALPKRMDRLETTLAEESRKTREALNVLTALVKPLVGTLAQPARPLPTAATTTDAAQQSGFEA